MFKKLLGAFSPGTFFQRFNKRRLQQEVDTHKLFLLTRYRALEQQGVAPAVDAIQKEADETPFEEQKTRVQENVHDQVTLISRLLHGLLTPGWEQAQADAAERLSRTKRQSGLGMAVGGGARSHQPGSDLKTDDRTVSRTQLSEKLRETLGYTLRLGPSEVEHADAGTGLFLSGTATPGSVVALYPGVLYDPSQYRQIPGYPRIDRDNPYFIARFDGVVIDAKPWGAGGDRRLEWDGETSLEELSEKSSQESESNQENESGRLGEMSGDQGAEGNSYGGLREGAGENTRETERTGEGRTVWRTPGKVFPTGPDGAIQPGTRENGSGLADTEPVSRGTRSKPQVSGRVSKPSEGLGWWKLVTANKGRAAIRGGTLLETRHPLALAHFANHPGKGGAANVVVCPYDFHVSSPGTAELRPYVPNALCPSNGDKRADTPIGYRSIWESKDEEDENLDSPQERKKATDVVRTLVLVASKEIRNEEVLLNYRLSPHVRPPGWYHPFDIEEDMRRWS